MTHVRTRLAAFAMALVVGVGVFLAGAPAAHAAISVGFSYEKNDNGYIIRIYTSGDSSIGGARWWMDPQANYTGDTLQAYDSAPDGHGVEAHLSTSPQRIATSRGKTVPYTQFVSGDLVEGSKWYMWVCMVKGTYSNCSNSVAVYA